jgi:phage tail-like protein
MAEFLTSSKFYFEADGITEKMISEISGLSSDSPVSGGGEPLGSGKNGVKIRQATPGTEKFENLTVKIIATNEKDLYEWYQKCCKNDGGKSSWTGNRKASSVTAYDQAGSMQARWEIVNSYPCKYVGPTLSATSGDMANETVELVHEGIKRVM